LKKLVSTMVERARITVTSGPDRGKSFDLTGQVVRVGRALDNEFVLTDPHLAEHQASIIHRDGRYAIVSTIPRGLEIDGTEIPAERWVWLPHEASIRVSERTSLEFVVNGAAVATAAGEEAAHQASIGPAPAVAASTSTASTAAAAVPVASGTASGQQQAGAPSATGSSRVLPKVKRSAIDPGKTSEPDKKERTTASPTGSSSTVARRKKAAADRADKQSRTVARFITDGPGDPLVKLGEDGHLPELSLSEHQEKGPREPKPKNSNPWVLPLAIGVSVLLSVAMLFSEANNSPDRTEMKTQARREIVEYYGLGKQAPEPYQLHLRQAWQARSRGDFEAERVEFQKVLALLRSEDASRQAKFTGITGRPDYDPLGWRN
jgi:hypothetical protein